MKSLSLSFIYACRELRAGLSGFYIFLLCLILGVGAIAAVQSVSQSFSDSLRYDGRYLLGGDLEIRTLYNPVTAEQRAHIEQNYGRISVMTETRAMVRRGDEQKSAIADIKAADAAYPLYGAVEVADDNGAKVETPLAELLGSKEKGFGALAEKELMRRLGAKVGDAVFIGKQRFTLSGVMVKQPDSISGFSYALSPHILVSSAALPATGLDGPASAVRYEHRVYMPETKSQEELEAAKKRLESAYPDAKWRVRTFYDASPRMKRYIERLTFFLTLIGLTTLVVGGVGISNAVRAWLDTKLANIATLKCLGASSGFVLRVYLMQMLMLAGLGIGIGLLLGAVAASWAGSFLTAQLSLTDTSGVYPSALLLAAVFGLLVTLAFSLWPLGRALKVAPAALFRDVVTAGGGRPSTGAMLAVAVFASALVALAVLTAPDMRMAAGFAGGSAFAIGILSFAAWLVQKILTRVKVKNWPEARLAIANLCRPGNATTGVVLSLGLGLTVLITISLVEYNFSRLLSDDLAEDVPSFFFVDVQHDQVEGFEKALLRAGGRNMTVMPSLRGRIVEVNGQDTEKALVKKVHEWVTRDRAFTWAADMPAHSRIIEGAWWPQDYSGPPLVSISTDVAEAFGIGAGAEMLVQILGEDITAKVANVRDVDWASFTMNFAVTFAPGALDEMPASSIATVIVPQEEEDALQTALARDYPNVTSIRVKEALETAGVVIAAVAQAVRISAAVTLLAGALVLAGSVAASRRRHVYDAIVLKVLGANRKRVASVFLLEYGLLGAVSVVIAAGIGTVAAAGVLEYIMNLSWKFSALSLASVAGACLFLTLLAGFFGTWQALGQKPAPWLRNQ